MHYCDKFFEAKMDLAFTNITGKEVRGKEKVRCKESKVEDASGVKKIFMKIHIQNVYVLPRGILSDLCATLLCVFNAKYYFYVDVKI